MTNERPRPAPPEPKRPYHVPVAIGLTTGVYAMSLLAATSLQIEADRALIADRAPVQAAIEALDVHHDRMESDLARAGLQYQEGTTGYDALAGRLAELNAKLTAVYKKVDSVERLSTSLPTELFLPSVPRTSGRGGSSAGAPQGGTKAVKLPPAPRAAAPPPTNGSTGASGG